MLDAYLEMCSVMNGTAEAFGTVTLLCSPIASARKPGRRGAGCNTESNEEVHYCFRGGQYDYVQYFIGQA